MVSQEFMNILRKQPQHNTTTTSSTSTSSGSEGRPLNVQDEKLLVIKEEKIDYDDTGQSAVGMITDNLVVKEETVDYDDTGQSAVGMVTDNLKLKVEEVHKGFSNDQKKFLSQSMVNRESNIVAPPLHQVSKGNEKVIKLPLGEFPRQLDEEKATLGHSNKRVIKKKIIFDPSDISSSSHKSQRRKALGKVKTEDDLWDSESDEHCMESPKLLNKIVGDKLRVSSGKGGSDMKGKNCKYCGRYVKREDYMRLHYMKHTGETPHKCTYCPNAYRTRWRLTQHLRTHTKDLPYHCPYCNYRGNRSDYLSSHVRRRHHKELNQSLQHIKEEGIADIKGKRIMKKRKGIGGQC